MINKTIGQLLSEYPFITSYFEDNQFQIENHLDKTFFEFLQTLSEDYIEDNALDLKQLELNFFEFIAQMKDFLGMNEETVSSLTILAGNNKSKEKEGFDSLTINKSEIISIVGPTGSGKSRLLADIEWTAQRDTPTNRGAC